MANGRLLDADRTALKQMVAWGNLYRANPYPLTGEESLEMYWQCFPEPERAAFKTLLNGNFNEYVKQDDEGMEVLVSPALIVTEEYPEYEQGSASMPRVQVPSPTDVAFPQLGWTSHYPVLKVDNPFAERLHKWLQEQSAISHRIDTATWAIGELANTGYACINTYGQLKRVWPDIVQVCPQEWQEHIAAASRTSRLPDGKSHMEWRKIQRGFETVTDLAVQSMMLKHVEDVDTRYIESHYVTAGLWDEWSGPQLREVPETAEDVKLPWE